MTFNVAFCTPPAIGVKVTVAVVEAPAFSDVDAGAPTENRAASGPVTVNGVDSTTGDALTLVSVTVWFALVETGTTPKLTGDGDAVTTIGAGTIVTVNGALPLHPLAVVACTVKVNVPAALGGPEITPAALNVKPVGSVPTLTVKVNGPGSPLAVTTPP